MNRPIYVTIQYLLTKSGPWNVYKSNFESAQICFEQIHHNVNSIKGTVDYKFKVKLGLVTNEISMICFEKKIIVLNFGFSAKVTCGILTIETMEKIVKIKHVFS